MLSRKPRKSAKLDDFWLDVISKADTAFCIFDADGQIEQSNKSFQELSGYSERELNRINWKAALIPPEEKDHQNKEPVVYEKELVRKDRSRVYVQVNLHLKKDKKGSIILYYCLITDLSGRIRQEQELEKANEVIKKFEEHDDKQRKKNEELRKANLELQKEIHKLQESLRTETERRKESETKFRSYIDDAPLGVVVVDDYGNYLEVNQAACEISGYTKKELLHMHVLEHLQKEESGRGLEYYGQLQRSGSASVEIGFIHKNGENRYWQISAVKLSDHKFIGFVRDTTDRKKAEKELLKSEAKLKNALQIAKLCYWEYDVCENMFTFNDQFYSIFHTSAEKMGGYKMEPSRYAETFVHPDDSSLVAHEIEKAINTKDPDFNSQVEHRIIYADGDIGYMSVRYFIVKDNNGKTIKTYGVNQDITTLRKTEQDLVQSEEKFRGIVENSQDVIMISRLDGSVFYISPACSEILGYEPEELTGKVINLIYLDDLKLVKDFQQQILQHEIVKGTIEYRIRTKSGSIKWVSHSFSFLHRDGTQDMIISIVRDITEKKETEEQIRASEMKFRTLVDQASEMLFLHDLEGNLIEVNEAAIKNTGYSREELENMKVFDLDPEAQNRDDMRVYWKSIKPGAPPVTFETMHKCKDGLIYPAEIVLSKIEYSGLKFILGLARNISERKKAELDLKNSEERFKMLSDLTFEGILIHSKGIIVDTNQSLLNMFGYKRDEVIGKSIFQLAIPEKYHQVIKEYIRQEKVEPYEIETFRKDGTLFPVEIVVREVIIKTEKLRVVAVRDITRRKAIERENLHNTEKYKSLFHNSLVGTGIGLPDGTLIDCNIAFANMLGYTKEEMLKINLSELYTNPEDRIRAKETLLEKGAIENFEVTVKHKSGKFVNLLLSSKTIKLNDNVFFQTSCLDITKIKRAEIELRKSQQTSKAILEAIPDLMFVIDDKYIFRNHYSHENDRLYVPPEQFLGRKVTEVLTPELAELTIKNIDKVLKDKKSSIYTYSMEIDGKIEYYESRMVYKSRSQVLAIIRDITEKKNSEETIRNNLREKEILLRELYHRTKNNLQVIISMLSLKANDCENELLINTYKEINSKIKSLALVQKKLYESKNLSELNLKDYIKDLIDLISQSHSPEIAKITFSYELDDISANLDMVVPLGLAISELVTNTFKHAFPKDRKGNVKVKLYKDKENKIHLEIEDDGIGIDKDIDLRKNCHMGLLIFFNLIEYQMRGKVEYTSDNGLKWKIEFNDDFYRKRV